MSIDNPANYNEWLYQEYVAVKVVYKITKNQCKNLLDDNPKKAEILKKFQEIKNKMVMIDKLLLKHIDYYADVLDSELNYSLQEDDIILLRKELQEVRKSIMEM